MASRFMFIFKPSCLSILETMHLGRFRRRPSLYIAQCKGEILLQTPASSLWACKRVRESGVLQTIVLKKSGKHRVQTASPNVWHMERRKRRLPIECALHPTRTLSISSVAMMLLLKHGVFSHSPWLIPSKPLRGNQERRGRETNVRNAGRKSRPNLLLHSTPHAPFLKPTRLPLPLCLLQFRKAPPESVPGNPTPYRCSSTAPFSHKSHCSSISAGQQAVSTLSFHCILSLALRSRRFWL